MRNTCVSLIPGLSEKVQVVRVIKTRGTSTATPADLGEATNLYLIDDPRLYPPPHETAAMGSTSIVLRFAPDAGRLACPSALLRGQASTYALKCFVPPRGPFSGGE